MGAAVGQLVIEEMNRVRQLARRRHITVKGVGICVPGIVAGKAGRVWAPNTGGWDDYPCAPRCGPVADRKLKVAIDSDSLRLDPGRSLAGAARDCRNAIFLAVGTGIGAGILVDGRVFHGAAGIAGALAGWRSIEPFRRSSSGRGCFESPRVGRRHCRRCPRKSTKHHEIQRSAAHAQPLTRTTFSPPIEHGDVIAKEVLSDAIEFWGMAGTANLISLFNPEKIIFGGGVFGRRRNFWKRSKRKRADGRNQSL